MRLKPTLTALFVAATLALPAAAQECVGQNLFDQLPPERMAEMQAAVEGVPYAHGLFWRAEKGDQRITLIGTYHFPDPRHDLILRHFTPEIGAAAKLLVEAGPEEEALLTKALSSDVALLVNAEGPTLPERLSEDEWQALSSTLEKRGVPPVIASRMQPWYVAVMLGVSPCMQRMMQDGDGLDGLDRLLIRKAEAADVPVQALEPWNALFTVFEGMTPREEEDMIRAGMPAAEHADDYTVTMTETYFAENGWLILEFSRFNAYYNSGLSRAEVDAQTEMAQDRMLNQRNARWIEPLEKAAAAAAEQGKGVVAGFGALHLPGEKGVLRLLESRGWKISPIRVEGIGDGG
ncbi:TraB/GumN family protein [Paracoccus kondratievae]|uniref:TraB/GumN family protein n=1 Tax=Paracoccus kondratievae TaxID=135740 RepID=A0AAD3RVL7_9RHOB|nr:TraB/GumN family protein [Paracoccus kondratievae]GLK65957.1 TraB/GumN family protein [Paracoccus kondratievae]